MLYARLSKRRLVIDWTDGGYTSDRSNSFHALFESPGVDPHLQIPEVDSIRPEVWKGFLHASAAEMIRDFDPGKFSSPTIHKKYSFSLDRLDYAEKVLVFWAFDHQTRRLRRHLSRGAKEFVGKSDDCILRTLLRNSLVLNRDIQEQVDAFARLNFTRPTIGVHIRYTDRKTSLSAFFRAVEKMKAKWADANIFLSTDNSDVIAAFTARFGKPVQPEKWFPPAGVAMHQNPVCPDRLRNAREALLDMYLLARCNALVFARSSTFGYVAKLLSDAAPENIFDVERLRVDIRFKRYIRYLIN
jgi:hypothetical protein